MSARRNNTNPLRVSTLNGVKIYNCSAGKTLPQWIDEAVRKQKSLRYNQEYRRRIELIQDFGFPTASTKVKLSRDGEFIAATGVYKPQIRVFELSQLSMKFERHVDAPVVQFQMLSDDFSKMVLLRADRTLEFHARFGTYHTTRVPKFGRDLAYHYPSCDLYVAGSSSDVWRLNLDQGRYMASLATDLPGINVIGVNPVHQLMAFGGENGVVEFWDPRVRERVADLNVSDSVAKHMKNVRLTRALEDAEVSALRYDVDGLGMAVGTSSGHVLQYDMRSSRPLLTKDHRYGLPVRSIKYHHGTGNVVSADRKSIRLWNKKTGKAFTSIEPMGDVAHVCLNGDSGMIMAAGEHQRIQIYYVPQLGPAPRWASFLDLLTEELEESGEVSIYDDYQFVTRQELQDWGIEDLIGSNLLRAYMHGFFMDVRLYNRVRSVAKPDAYESYVRKQINEKIKERRKGRLALQQALPNVNKEYAKALLNQPRLKRKIREEEEKKQSSAAEDVIKNPLMDPRFSAMFESDDFQIDADSQEYQRLHPSNFGRSKGAQDASGDDGGKSADAPSSAGASAEQPEGRPGDEDGHSSSDEEYETLTRDDRFGLVQRDEDDADDSDDGPMFGDDDDVGRGTDEEDEDELDELFGRAKHESLQREERREQQRQRRRARQEQRASQKKGKRKRVSMFELTQGRLDHVLQPQSKDEQQERHRAKTMSLEERLRHRKQQKLQKEKEQQDQQEQKHRRHGRKRQRR